MKSLKLGWSVLGLLLLVTACKGKDPGDNYSQVKQAANLKETPGAVQPPVQPPAPPIPPPPPDNSQLVCYEPFKLSVDPDSGINLMKFTEDTQATFTITVRSMMRGDFTVTAENLDPSLSSDFAAGRASLKEQPKDPSNPSVATYKFTWKPAKLNFSPADFHTLTLRYQSAAATNCGGDISQKLNLAVVPQTQVTGATK